MFKTGMEISATQSPVFIFHCLDSDLKDDDEERAGQLAKMRDEETVVVGM